MVRARGMCEKIPADLSTNRAVAERTIADDMVADCEDDELKLLIVI